MSDKRYRGEDTSDILGNWKRSEAEKGQTGPARFPEMDIDENAERTGRSVRTDAGVRSRDAGSRSGLRSGRAAGKSTVREVEQSTGRETGQRYSRGNGRDRKRTDTYSVGEPKRESVRSRGQSSADKRLNRKRPEPSGRNGNDGQDIRKLIILIALAAAVIMFVSGAIYGAFANRRDSVDPSQASGASVEQTAGDNADQSGAMVAETTEAAEPESDIYAEAELMAAQYDYDGAIDLLKSQENYDSDTKAQAAVSDYEAIKETLVEQDINTITHIFFHILSVDPENSFNKDKWGTQADGYNGLMTTVSEFKKILESMYEKGYVLVSIRDLARETVDEDGNTVMEKGSIMLPPGKKAFVMSEDDVCYYEYMEGAGFADKMVVDENGKPVNHYVDAEGNEHTGAYDLVPILDEFIEEHPDFSYKGHKACLVFTGYNGILGYRTDESYDPSSEYYDPSLEQGHDVEVERAEAVKVLKALHEDGYDLGSHSWGHRDLGQIEYDRFKKDCDRWERNVASLIREATGEQPDIIIYPRGADIADWRGYSSDNERFRYLYDLGFRYFCNVDNGQYWVQLGDNYLRQGRRAIDGYNLWLELSGEKDRMGDLFDDVSLIFDDARPTPVPSY